MELAVKTTAAPQYGRQVDDGGGPQPCCFYGWAVWLVLVVGQITTFFGTSSGIAFILDDIMCAAEKELLSYGQDEALLFLCTAGLNSTYQDRPSLPTT